MQKCTIIGNVGSISIWNGEEFEKVQTVTGEKKGTKVFLSIGDHYYSSKDSEMKTRFIQLQGFVPKNLKISTGQLLALDFVINPYQNGKNEWKEAKDIINWDVSLRSSNRGPAASEDDEDFMPDVDENGFMNIPDIPEELPFN